jgi:hypothetical protein
MLTKRVLRNLFGVNPPSLKGISHIVKNEPCDRRLCGMNIVFNDPAKEIRPQNFRLDYPRFSNWHKSFSTFCSRRTFKNDPLLLSFLSKNSFVPARAK